jgi:hypothetical protein
MKFTDTRDFTYERRKRKFTIYLFMPIRILHARTFPIITQIDMESDEISEGNFRISTKLRKMSLPSPNDGFATFVANAVKPGSISKLFTLQRISDILSPLKQAWRRVCEYIGCCLL